MNCTINFEKLKEQISGKFLLESYVPTYVYIT